MASNDKTSTIVDEPTTKLYRLLSGSITRYEGSEAKDGTRKVVTYESDGSAAGNEVWLTEREVEFVGLKKLEEVHGAGNRQQAGAGGASGAGSAGRIAAPPAATSLTGAPAGGPVEDETESEEGDAGGVNVGDAMTASASASSTGISGSAGSGNPAVDRVLAKKAAGK